MFPKAEQLIQKMELEQTYKDVTFETLNKPDFLSLIKVAFPAVDWERTYEEYWAAGEKKAYSNRIGVGVDDQDRADKAIRGMVGKRLTYRGPNAL